MQNNYIILTAMYRYAPTFFAGNPSEEKLRAKLLSLNPHSIPGAKLLTKKALESNYGITNREQMENTINELMLCNWWDGPIYAILIDLFLANPDAFTRLTEQEVASSLQEPGELNSYVARFLPVNQMLDDNERRENYLKELAASVAAYFSPEHESTLHEISELFRHNQSWLKHTSGIGWAAFNYSRAISIIADAAICGYLSDEEAAGMCDAYGSAAVQLFGNWQTFLLSAILGKQLLTPAQDRFILGANDYIEGCYRLASSPLKPLELSGIWLDSDLSALIASFAAEYSDDPSVNTKKSGPLGIFQNTVLPLFSKYGMEYFLLDRPAREVFYYLPDELPSSSGKSFFEVYVGDFEPELEPGETPFLSSSKYMLTNKGIHIHIKKLFRKKQKLIIPWKSSVELKWEPSLLGDIQLHVNGHPTLEIKPNMARIGISHFELLKLSKKELRELLTPDLDKLNQAIRELQQVFSE